MDSTRPAIADEVQSALNRSLVISLADVHIGGEKASDGEAARRALSGRGVVPGQPPTARILPTLESLVAAGRNP